jgi:hypothetical protein
VKNITIIVSVFARMFKFDARILASGQPAPIQKPQEILKIQKN